jgi:hypothetical protein
MRSEVIVFIDNVPTHPKAKKLMTGEISDFSTIKLPSET